VSRGWDEARRQAHGLPGAGDGPVYRGERSR